MAVKAKSIGQVLVTDTLFIFPEHEAALNSVGYEVVRLAKPDATEEELIEAIQGKAGYLLGGIEMVTDKVIEAADQLKAIVYTGSDAKAFIPGYELATQKGISIANAPGANSYAVAEYTVTMMLMMTRRVLELGRTGTETFITTESMANMHIGICGLEKIGEQVAKMLLGLGVPEISYYSRTRKPEVEEKLGINYLTFDRLFSECNIVTIHTPDEAGMYVTDDVLRTMPEQALIVNTNGSGSAIDTNSLFNYLIDGKLKAAFDYTIDDKRFNDLPYSVWFCSNMSAAYNTREACKKASDMATETIIDILTKGADEHVLNF